MKLRLDEEDDGDDPLLSLVNLIDVFLVVIAALMLAIARHPVNPFSDDEATVIRKPGMAEMEIVKKDGTRIEHFRASGETTSGQGVRVGTAYRLADGSLIYVPE